MILRQSSLSKTAVFTNLVETVFSYLNSGYLVYIHSQVFFWPTLWRRWEPSSCHSLYSNSTQGLCTLCLMNSNFSISRRRNLELERWCSEGLYTEFLILGANVPYRATCYLGTSSSGDPWICSQWNGHQVSKSAFLGFRVVALQPQYVYKPPSRGTVKKCGLWTSYPGMDSAG